MVGRNGEPTLKIEERREIVERENSSMVKEPFDTHARYAASDVRAVVAVNESGAE